MKYLVYSGLFLLMFSAVGCGADNDLRESAVDDSVVHTEDQMAEMEASNAADMQSQ